MSTICDNRGGGHHRKAGQSVIGALKVALVVTPLVAGAVVGCASGAAPTAQAPPSPSECGWNLELSEHTLDDINVAAPDTAAAYWVLRYRVKPSLNITVEGNFPDARYISFNTYDWRFRSFTANDVASSIADYQIAPDPGAANPWRQPAAAGGSYTVKIRPNPNPSEVNTLPLAPPETQDERDGFLIFRVYRPGGDPATVELPKVSLASASETQTFAACTKQDPNFGAALRRSPRAGQPLPSREPVTGFARINAGGISAFANVDNAYLKYFLNPPPPDHVLVVRGKAPTHPADDNPTPWPRPGIDVRYFSLCTYPSIFPAPLTQNSLPDGTVDYGCRTDQETKLDAAGYYTYVVGTESQHHQVDAVPDATFVPLSADHPGDHFLLFRNLLRDDDFRPAIHNVPPNSTPEQSAAIMGDYYPRIKLCALDLLAAQGISGCPV